MGLTDRPGRARVPAAVLAAGLALCLAGCLTLPPRSRAPSAGAQVLDGVPVHEFGVDRCGAGSLSAVLEYLGDPVSMAELDAVLPKATNNGVLSLDMILAARARGHEARLVTGSPELLEATLLSGRPAILMLQVLDAPGLGKDYYHYVVADGVDPERSLFRLQFGDGKRRWAPLAGLERAWKGTGHTLILVEPAAAAAVADPSHPAEGPAAPRAGRALAYGMALEDAGRPDEAAAVYRGALEREPESARAWTNLGNAEAADGRLGEAESAYRRALALDPDHRDALNNLAWLLLEAAGAEAERLEEAEALASRAVTAGGPDPHLALDTLARVQAAQGSCQESAETFTHALQAAPPESPEHAQIQEAATAAAQGCERRLRSAE
jgi:Flp pilus assembly protein TadD